MIYYIIILSSAILDCTIAYYMSLQAPYASLTAGDATQALLERLS